MTLKLNLGGREGRREGKKKKKEEEKKREAGSGRKIRVGYAKRKYGCS